MSFLSQHPNLTIENLPPLPAGNEGTYMACATAVVEGELGFICAGTTREASGGDRKQVIFMPMARDANGNWQVGSVYMRKCCVSTIFIRFLVH